MQVLSVPVSQHFQRVNFLPSISEAGKRFAAGHRTVIYRARYCERLIWHALEVQWCWDVTPPHKAWDPQLKSNASWCSLFIFLIFSSPIPWKPFHTNFPTLAGPYSLNGVPLKRVNQRYCIATSAKVDLGAAEARRLFQGLWWHPWDFRKVVGK